jgi:transcriptional regulator GlxA family with amidase domain
MDVAIGLYENFTALDCVGPYDVLSRLPGARVRWVAAERGPVRADAGLVVHAQETFADVSAPDVLLLPGGMAFPNAESDPELIAWVRTAHERTAWTTSVCTGSLILGHAGVLDGLRATSHWAALPLLANLGATPVEERVVLEGKVATAAGVSAGIDLALVLCERIAGREVAEAIQLGIEYDPEPPFATGNAARAPQELRERALGALAAASSAGQ